MNRFICIHGHFYQPPRENPWLEAIEVQDGAAPYHDWNKRITAECYAANAASRILDDKGRILRIVNNYEKISFNFGPTLLSWMESNSPFAYSAILEADAKSREAFGGHGSALAQPYNHMIMPLASLRDKITQVKWGIRDFERRFGREPEGMWLPETAVDLETLRVMADHGIRFTILAPRQALRVRAISEEDWHDVEGERIDPKFPYRVDLSGGGAMALFFYDGGLSRAVAFEHLLASGEALAGRLASAFSDEHDEAQLVHMATDGESYGHHHRFGDMALAYAVHFIETRGTARITNYGEFLAQNPPMREVEIAENTSWSCVHGVQRWKADCGCHTGSNPAWNQAWRGPLRDALDNLNAGLAGIYEERGGTVLKDAWGARDGYIDVVLDRSPETRRGFLESHAAVPPDRDAERLMLQLLEMQRHAMLMYTSCGWFFDDASGIETVQVLLYAARAVELAREIAGRDLEPAFLERLAAARSNRKEMGTGRDIYRRAVAYSVAGLKKVAAHHAMSLLFRNSVPVDRFYCYRVEDETLEVKGAGKASLLLGRARFVSDMTLDSADLCFGALNMGDHSLTAGVARLDDSGSSGAAAEGLWEVFEAADYHETLRRFDRCFSPEIHGLKSLFRDEQRRILGRIMEATLSDVERVYRRLYDTHLPLMRFLMDAGAPLPKALKVAAEFVLHTELKRRFQHEDMEPERIESVLKEAGVLGVEFDADSLEFVFRKTLERTADRLTADPGDVQTLLRLDSDLSLLESLPFSVNLRSVQNLCYDLKENKYPDMRERAGRGDEDAREWVEAFVKVSEKLWLRID
jgi:alpha-amylase/alpha-mannosidase (GH57 family)